MPDTRCVLLDTDIGTDIDDAIALTYLLQQPRCDLLGITTVTGQPDRRAALASAFCHAAGRPDIPIYSGAARPMLIEQQQKTCQQASVLRDYPHRGDFSANEAVQFMRAVIRSRPGQVTLLAIGPLTNVALLFALDPEIPSLLRELVLMCGAFSRRGAEWNAKLDPHAAAIVYASEVPRHVSYGLDVTLQCQMLADECRRRWRGGAYDLLLAAAEVWFTRTDVVTFHDPLAAVGVFEPDVCGYATGRVSVELASQHVLGMTHWDTSAQRRPHQVGVSVDRQKFFARYFEVM